MPRSVELLTEPLPLSGAGKILKTELPKPPGRRTADASTDRRTASSAVIRLRRFVRST
jgi:hypothetical protein